MDKANYKVLGVMSGTSLDGTDIACVNFQFDGDWQFKIESFETIPKTFLAIK